MIAKGNGIGEKNPAAVALGSIKSPAKKIASPKNSLGNKSKTGQKASAETIAKLEAAWVVRKEKAAKKKAAAINAAAGMANDGNKTA